MWCDGRMGVKLIFTALVFMEWGSQDVDGWTATGLCVQVGQANWNRKRKDTASDCAYDDWYSHDPNNFYGYYTIGTYKYRTTHAFMDCALWKRGVWEDTKLACFDPPSNQSCPYTLEYDPNPSYNTYAFINFCPTDNEVEIRTLAVKQNGVIMQGWLHFEVELMDKSDEIYGIYVQVRDEWFNAIGEFVSKKEEQCSSANPDLVYPTRYQVLPCSAIGYREAKISSALFMVNPIMLRDKTAGMPYLTPKNMSRGIQFTWRLSEYWCNRHLRFRPEAIIFTKKMYTHNSYINGKPTPYRKAAAYWIFPKWYRAADIKLDGTALTCDEKVIDYTPRGSKVELEKNGNEYVAPWLSDMAEESTLDNDYVSEKQVYWDNTSDTTGAAGIGRATFSLKSCHANTRQRNQPTFAGRCKHHYEKNPSHDALQGCNLDATAPEFADLPADLPTYQDYLHQLTVNRTRLCSTPCRAPVDMTDLLAIQQYNTSRIPTKKPVVLKFTNIGATRNGSKVQKFWAGRKFHGQALTFWSMFLIPVGTFASRYLKETVMSKACIGFHMWYWIHLATNFLGGGLLGCGYLALYELINTFGRSLNEFSGMHRLLSISSIVLFGLMLVVGAYRSINLAFRKAILFLHSFLGFSIYIINLAAMIMSTWIPASPSMSDKCDPDGRPEGLSNVALVIMVWIVMDIVCHVGMTALQYMVDKKIGARRSAPKYCPIIPYLPAESITDLKGKHFRKIIFLVYIVVSFIFTMTVIYMLDGGQVTEECRNKTGPSTCEDPWGCSNWARAYSQTYPQGTTEAPKAAN